MSDPQVTAAFDQDVYDIGETAQLDIQYKGTGPYPITLTAIVMAEDANGAVVYTRAVTQICDPFVEGQTKPDALNTGLGANLLNEADLTVVAGDLILNQAWLNAHPLGIVDQVWVKGHVVFTADGPVTLSNSIVEGRSFPTAGSPPKTAIIYARSSSTAATSVINVINCEVFPVQPDMNIVCMSGERLGKVRRCNVFGGSDLIDYWGARVDVHGCYLHDFTFWKNDPKHVKDASRPGWSHNDGIQTNGCDGGEIIGNTFDMRAHPYAGDRPTLIAAGFANGAWGSAVMLSGSVGLVTNMVITDNWFAYGQAPIALPYQSGGAFENGGSSWLVTRNRFAALPDPYGTQHQLIRWGAGKGVPVSSVFDNYFTDDPEIPEALRGTALPKAVLVGSGMSGQYIVKVTS
jgi:hypothetical protein